VTVVLDMGESNQIDIMVGGEAIGICAGIWMIRYLWYSI
jgi:hypothetical protein